MSTELVFSYMCLCFVFKEVKSWVKVSLCVKVERSSFEKVADDGNCLCFSLVIAQYLNSLNIIGFRQQKGNLIYKQSVTKGI